MNKYEAVSMIVAMAICGAVAMTLITSWYGMNFSFREYHFRHPLAYVAALCVLTVGLTWWYLRRNDWL